MILWEKKEQEGGAFENEKSSTEETKSNKNKNLGTVNMTRYGQEQGDKSDFVLGLAISLANDQ